MRCQTTIRENAVLAFRMVERACCATDYSSASYAAVDPYVTSESGNFGLLLFEELLSTAWIAEASRATSGFAYFMVFTSFLFVISCYK